MPSVTLPINALSELTVTFEELLFPTSVVMGLTDEKEKSGLGAGVGVGVGVGVAGGCNSNAPTSVPSAAFMMFGSSKIRANAVPRWSLVNPLLVPLSIAGLSGWSAIVSVGPPLLRKPAGSNFGSSGEALVPV